MRQFNGRIFAMWLGFVVAAFASVIAQAREPVPRPPSEMYGALFQHVHAFAVDQHADFRLASDRALQWIDRRLARSSLGIGEGSSRILIAPEAGGNPASPPSRSHIDLP